MTDIRLLYYVILHKYINIILKLLFAIDTNIFLENIGELAIFFYYYYYNYYILRV